MYLSLDWMVDWGYICLSGYADIKKEPSLPQAVDLFKALGDETRLRIINLIARREICVCDLVKILKVGQSKVSRHLAYLGKIGLVSGRRNGAWVLYSLAKSRREIQRRIVDWVLEVQEEIPRGTEDLKRLYDLGRRGALCNKNPVDFQTRTLRGATAAKRS